jgi:NTP pyrophosphatase (non-canonical NTP hydrolase)
MNSADDAPAPEHDQTDTTADDVGTREPDAPAPSLTLAEYQRAAGRTINQSLTAEQRLVDAAAGLAEEAGEVLGLVRKYAFMRHGLDRVRLTTELGDALWCLTGVAAAVGISLDEVASANLEKLRRRYPDGYSDTASARRADVPPDAR